MSTNHFNSLSESELERLSILNEECGEVIQIIGKTLRHGFESYSPIDPDKLTNRTLLEKEIADVLYAYQLMIKNGDINEERVLKLIENKKSRIAPYLHHNE